MFNRLVSKIKEVLYKMNLIKGIKELKDHKDIYVNDEMYDSIDKWKALYKGYYKDIHDIGYHTIEEGHKTRRMNSLNLPKVVSEEMASLIFNEKCEVNISDETLKENIYEIFKQNKFNKNFQDNIEFMLAFGGMVIKPYVKDDKIKLSFVTADCFIPIAYSNDGISEGVFVNEWWKGKFKYTHLEWHVWEDVYTVINEVYRSENANDLGIQVPIESVLPGIEPVLGMAKVETKLFAYFKPNIANNIDTHSPMGISLFGNAIDTIQMLDTMFDSFNQEFVLGKKKIIVPAHMMKTVINPDTGLPHRYFDASNPVYEAFEFGDMDSDKIVDIDVTLRVEEHTAAINAGLNLFAMQTGFSAGTFSFNGESMKTATEVVSEQSKTFKSKKSHETIIEAGLTELVDAIVQLAKQYNIFTTKDGYEVTVAFDDSVAEDKTAELTKSIMELTNKMKPKYKIIASYYGIDEEEAKKWIAEINEESATTTEEDVNFFGTGGNTDD